MSRPDPRLAPLVVLALLLGLAAVMLYRVPVHRYVVACERTAGELACVLEQARTAGAPQRWRVSLGPDSAAAVVRVMPQRRGGARVLLYLESPNQAPVFAAEFEGAGAATDAAAAAAQLNQVLRPSATATSAATRGPARVEAAAPPVFRWVAWAGLGIMGLLIVAAARHVARAPAAGTA